MPARLPPRKARSAVIAPNFGDDWLRIGGFKALFDGGVEAARLSTPYRIVPGEQTDPAFLGQYLLPPGGDEEAQAMFELAAERGWHVLLTTYELASLEAAALSRVAWSYIVVDEAHRLKNEQSSLATVVRSFSAAHRLLITGTPLQNNLHELWALLNFLLPDVFGSSDAFDRWFDLAAEGRDEEAKANTVKQLHRVLRPFMLRRLKADVAKGLPSALKYGIRGTGAPGSLSGAPTWVQNKVMSNQMGRSVARRGVKRGTGEGSIVRMNDRQSQRQAMRATQLGGSREANDSLYMGHMNTASRKYLEANAARPSGFARRPLRDI
jgi:hypothetical protein